VHRRHHAHVPLEHVRALELGRLWESEARRLQEPEEQRAGERRAEDRLRAGADFRSGRRDGEAPEDVEHGCCRDLIFLKGDARGRSEKQLRKTDEATIFFFFL